MKDYHAGWQGQWQGYLLLQQRERAFTLIELLVVTVIVGILAAVSLPNLIDQVGKARETEAKNQLGSMSRAQQAFHVEKQVFANSLNELSLTGSFTGEYYEYLEPDTQVDFATQVEHKANAWDASKDRVRNYAVGIYFNAGVYDIIICQSDEVGGVVDVPDTSSGTCIGGAKLK